MALYVRGGESVCMCPPALTASHQAVLAGSPQADAALENTQVDLICARDPRQIDGQLQHATGAIIHHLVGVAGHLRGPARLPVLARGMGTQPSQRPTCWRPARRTVGDRVISPRPGNMTGSKFMHSSLDNIVASGRSEGGGLAPARGRPPRPCFGPPGSYAPRIISGACGLGSRSRSPM